MATTQALDSHGPFSRIISKGRPTSWSVGRVYQAFQEGGDGKALVVGVLDPGPNGAAFTAAKDLPEPAAAKRVFVVLNDEKAKEAPAGAKPVIEASLQPPAKKAEAD